MHIGLVLNGDPPTPDDLALLDDADLVICADGGANFVYTSDRQPDVIVGDLDSIDPTLIARAEEDGVELVRHDAHKDFTDGELAVEVALDRKAEQATVLGAHGQRTSMFLGNLHLLRRLHEAGVDARLVGQDEVLSYCRAGDTRTFARREHETLNVLAVDAAATITLEGTAYDVAELVLEPTAARGVSNTVTGKEGRLVVHAGTVLTILERYHDRS